MKSRGATILATALGAFFTGGVAFGQAPSNQLGAAQPSSDQSVRTGLPAAQNSEAGLPPDRKSAAAAGGMAQLNPLWAIPLESLQATRERPLFSASRRPATAVVEEAPKISAPAPAPLAAELEKPQFTLVGVVHGPSVQMGVFVDETDKSLVRLRVGQSTRGWTVHGVEARAATLEKAEQQVKLELPARSIETAVATTNSTDEEASAPLPGPSGPIHGTPVGRIKPFATAERLR